MKYFVIISILIISCKPFEHDEEGTTQENSAYNIDTMFGEKWYLTEIDGNRFELSDPANQPTMTLDFDAKKVTGYAGCNQYFGSIDSVEQGLKRIDLGWIRFGDIASTEMACPDLELESRFLVLLAGEHNMRLSNHHHSQLILTNKDSSHQLTFNRLKLENLPLMKEIPFIESELHDIWALEKINEETIELIPDGKRPTIEIFVRDMRVNGNAGCNNYFGPIKNLQHGIIEFGNVASTRMACPQMELEGKYFSVLNDISSYKREKLQLYLFTDDKRSLQYRKVD